MRAHLTIVFGEGDPKVCELLPGEPLRVGRHHENDLVVRDETVSRHHAEIYCESGRWFIRDKGGVNTTRINGKVITGPTELRDGHLIDVGKTSLRFSLELATNGVPGQPATGTQWDISPSCMDSPTGKTVLLQDELMALCGFMAAAVKAGEPRPLIQQALESVHRQLGATVSGFLSLDKENPLPKVVLPRLAAVDIHLSKWLTQEVEKQGRTVWKKSQPPSPTDDDSLQAFADAICVPLRAGKTPLGALHVYRLGKPFQEREALFLEVLAGHLANSLHLLRVHRTLEAENSRLRVHSQAGDELIGTSLPLQELRQRIARLALRPSTVLIVGESGAGKELVALALHRQSPRREGPLVSVNCAAFTAALLESELFGHCKGAFTGADHDRAGVFEQADEGTLFLDEVGELSLDCQARLLRVIEGKGFRRVGGTSEIEVNVRILAATNRQLEKEVETNRLRRDLYFRLQGIEIRVPPLREHLEDIPELVETFLNRFAVEWGRRTKVTEEALRRLQDYAWPGNVRQLRAVLENAVASTDREILEPGDLLLPTEGPTTESPPLNLKKLEAWAVQRALCKTDGNITQAARLLGVARETFNAMMRRYGVERKE